MNTINSYLIFNGNCEEAFTYYKKVFKAEYGVISRYKDMPQTEGCDTIPEKWVEKIMHVSLLVNGHVFLMGGDTNPNFGAVGFGTNYHLSVSADGREEADRLYTELSEGGTVVMPITDTFWGDYFGMLTDKFGIRWMVNYSTKQL